MKPRTLLVLICLSLPAPCAFAQSDATKNAIASSPAIPEEARKHFVMGTTLFKDAKTPDDFAQVESQFKQAVDLAPQWPEARYNLALAKEAAGDYSGAMADLKLYQQFKLTDAEARTVQDKIYALEAKSEETAKRQAAETREKDLTGARWSYKWVPTNHVDGYTDVVYSANTLIATKYYTRDTWSKVSSVGRPYVSWTLPLEGSPLGKTLPLSTVDGCTNCGPYSVVVSGDGQTITLTCDGRICPAEDKDPMVYRRK